MLKKNCKQSRHVKFKDTTTNWPGVQKPTYRKRTQKHVEYKDATAI